MMRLKAKSASFKALTAVAVCAAMVMMGASGASASEDPVTTSQEEVAVEAAPTNDAAPTQEQVAPAPAPAPEPAPAPAPESAPAPAPEPDPVVEAAPKPAHPAEEAPAAPSTQKAPAVNTTTEPDQEDDNTGEDEVWAPKSTVEYHAIGCLKDGYPQFVEGNTVEAEGERVSNKTLDGEPIQGDVALMVENTGTHTYAWTVTNLATGETRNQSGTFMVVACGDETPVVYTPPATTFKLLTPCDVQAAVVEVTVPEYDTDMGQYRVGSELVAGPGVYTLNTRMAITSFQSVEGVEVPVGSSSWFFSVDEYCSDTQEPEEPVAYNPPAPTFNQTDVCTEGGAPIVEVTIHEYDRTMGQYRLFGEPLDGPGVYTAPGTLIRVDFQFADDVTPGEGTALWTYKADKDCCEEPELPVVTLPSGSAPTFTDVCGVDKDKVNVPANGSNYAYIITDQRVDGVGLVKVDLVANEGYQLPEGTKTHWQYDFTNESCPPVEEPEEPVNPEPQPPLTPVTPQKPAVPAVPKVTHSGGTGVVKGVGIGTGSEQVSTASNGEAFAGFVGLTALFAALGLGLTAVRRRRNA